MVSSFRRIRRIVRVVVLLALMVSPLVLFAQQSSGERAAQNLEATFTGPLARSLALVAIVVGGLMFMFGEGGAKRQISGIVFGGGLALFAGQVSLVTQRGESLRGRSHARQTSGPPLSRCSRRTLM